MASSLCSCFADMPLEWVATSQAAQNHTLSGRWVRCMTVPAVTDVSLPQPLQPKVSGVRLGKRHACRPPQRGQAKPPASACAPDARRTRRRRESVSGIHEASGDNRP